MILSRLYVLSCSLVTLFALSGCCVDRSMCGPAACSTPACGTAGCGTAGCGVAEPIGEPYCGPGGCCAADDYFCQGPFGYLRYMFTWGSGCGDYYVDEWISDPPSCCDPCDNYGNWTGPQSCCRPLLSGLDRLWGYRYEGGGCESVCQPGCDGGCGPGCSGQAGPMGDSFYHGDGGIVEQGPWMDAEPLPQPQGQQRSNESQQQGVNPSAKAPRRLQQSNQRSAMRPVGARQASPAR